MIVADILQWFLLIVGALLTLLGHWLGAWALVPALIERARTRATARPIRTLLTGLIIALPLLLLSFVLAKRTGSGLVHAGVIGMWLVIALIALVGSAALARRIGLGLPGGRDADQPWRAVLRGGAVLGLCFLMPFLGWFVLLPATLAFGLGAVVLAGRAPAAMPMVAATETPAP